MAVSAGQTSHRDAATASQAPLARPALEKNALTPADAQAAHDAAKARNKWLLWMVTSADVEHPERYVARAHEADHHGGMRLPGALVANTLGELRAILPAGLTRSDRTSLLPPDVIETWD